MPDNDNNNKDNGKMMSTLMDITTWQKFQDALSMMTGLSTMTLDPQGRLITEPSNYNDFCLRYLRHNTKARTMCEKSHREASRTVAESGKPVMYRCHAGFSYFAVPVMINNTHLTTIVGGQIIGKNFNRENLKKLARSLKLTIPDFEGELQRVQSLSEDQFVKAKDLIENLVGMINQVNFEKYGLKKEVAELSALHEITNLVGSVGDFDKMLHRLCEKIAQISGIDQCTLTVRDEKIDRFLVAASPAMTKAFRNTFIEITRDILFERRFMIKDPCIIQDLKDIIEKEAHDLYVKNGIARRITVPLMVRERVIGLLELYPSTDTALPKERLDLFIQIAYQTAVAIDNAAIFSHAERLATTDGLTGLINYRTFHHMLALEIKRAHRYKQDLSMLMLDIDNFKSVNDTYGHLIGNVVLCEFANIMRRGVREVDIVTRFGGEEFAIVLPATPVEGAMILAERLCTAIREFPFPGPGNKTLRLTASIGVSEYNREMQSMEDFLDLADKAMLKAKVKGKDMALMLKFAGKVKSPAAKAAKAPASKATKKAKAPAAKSVSPKNKTAAKKR